MKKGILFSILLLVFSFPLNSALASELTDDYFDIGVNYFNVQNYLKSTEYLDLVLRLEPDNLKTLTLRNKILPLLSSVDKQALYLSKMELQEVFLNNLDYNNKHGVTQNKRVECK